MVKLFAILVMTLDHADRILFGEAAPWATVLGRFAFPLFAFMVARNALYTRNPRRYAGLLLLFGIISQPVYVWALEHESFWNPLNVLFTLLLGLLAVRAWMARRYWALPLLLAAGWWVEYRVEGVALMLAVGIAVHSIRASGLWHRTTLSALLAIGVLAFFLNQASYLPAEVIDNRFVPWVLLAFAIGFASLHPRLDAAERRLTWPGFRLFFYAYYPGHLLALGLVALALGALAA